MVSFDPKKDIVAATGLQGYGKTLLLVSLAKKYYDQGFPIYSNITLKKPYFKDYEHIDSIEDLEKMRYGFALLDEAWLWVFSRSAMSKMNQDITKIIMLNRKRDISIWYSSQLGYQTDKLLRGVSRFYLHPMIYNYIHPEEKRYLKAHVYNQLGYNIGTILIEDIKKYFPMYDTREEIKRIGKQKTDGRPGSTLEHECYNTLIDMLGVENVMLFPDSGAFTPYPGDIGIIKNGVICHIIDVKNIEKNGVANIKPDGCSRYIHFLESYNILSSIAHKKMSNWIFTPVTLDKPFIANKTGVSNVVLQEHGMTEKEFVKWINRCQVNKLVIDYE